MPKNTDNAAILAEALDALLERARMTYPHFESGPGLQLRQEVRDVLNDYYNSEGLTRRVDVELGWQVRP